MPVDTKSALTITLLGPFSAQLNGTSLHLPEKGQGLLALLVLEQGREVPRAWFAGRLWPESEVPLLNLRQLLPKVRKALGGGVGCLQTPPSQTLRLDLAAATVDLIEFRAAIMRGDLPSLQQAVALYRGPLLEGCEESWVLQDRTDCQQQYLTALETLAHYASASDDHATAERYWRLAVAVDPAREAAQRALMQVLAKSEDYGGEAQVYHDLRAYLHDQHRRSPEPATITLHHQIQEKARRRARESSVLRRRDPASPPPRFIPTPITSFVERREDLRQIKAKLLSARLLTLTGSGGIGKTRLAIQVAEEVADDYQDGVYFVGLAALTDPNLMISAVSNVLDVKEQPGQPLEKTLLEHLQSRAILLVLDNCEHLLSACASLVTVLLSGCRNLRVLTTSRQSLGLGEVVWRVPALSVPDPKQITPDQKDQVSILKEYEAIQLFVERAQAVDPTFRLTPHNASLIAQICHRLDGIPHAIELAAACILVLSVDEIVARLDDRFHLLTGGSRTALPHQQTLLTTLDWSYDLLTADNADAQRLLARLSVFVGGWTLSAAEAVGADESTAGEGIEQKEVLSLLTSLINHSLVDKSLMAYGEQKGQARYRLLETVREYAAEKLVKAGEAETVRRRHRDYFQALAEKAEEELWGTKQSEWLARLEAEHANLRSVLEGEVDQTSMRLAGSLWRFWYMRGYIGEAYTRLIGLLNSTTERGDRSGRARVLMGAGSLAHVQGDQEGARIFLEQSIELYRELAEQSRLAEALKNLALVASAQREFAEAQKLHEASLAIQVERGNTRGIASSRMNLGCLAFEQGDYEAARTMFEECLILFRGLDNQSTVSSLLMNLGVIAQISGDYTEALKYHEESLKLKRELGDKLGIANSLLNMGELALLAKEYASALSLCQESLSLYNELELMVRVADALNGLAYLAASQNQHDCAVCLWGVSVRLREETGNSLSSNQQDAYEQAVAASAQILGDQAFSKAWTLGRAMTQEQAIKFALELSV